MEMELETTRLRLQAHMPRDLLALMQSVAAFEASTGLRAAEGLRTFMLLDDISPAWRSRLLAAREADLWEHGFAVVLRENNSVIGSAGFKGAVDAQGVVEIAYGIVPSYEGHGYATEAALALVAFAFARDGVRCVRAHTLPTGAASMRVLAKTGFTHVGEIDDPDDGKVWRWERRR